jgi:hypothetical protein
MSLTKYYKNLSNLFKDKLRTLNNKITSISIYSSKMIFFMNLNSIKAILMKFSSKKLDLSKLQSKTIASSA